MSVGGEVLNIKAFPRNSIKLKGMERSSDASYFRLKEFNSSSIQVLLDKSLEDLVDRDIPQNLLKFKIQCNNFVGRTEEASYLTVTVYVEDINDNYPKFMGSPYTIHVDESTPVGKDFNSRIYDFEISNNEFWIIGSTVYSGITAFDRDKPNTPNSDVQFSIGPQDYPGGPYFAIEHPHRPAIVLRKKLDYDEGLRKFDITIIASVRKIILI